MHFESWTGVLQVQPCFKIIYKFIFGVLRESECSISLLNLTVFVTARDIYSLLILRKKFIKIPVSILKLRYLIASALVVISQKMRFILVVNAYFMTLQETKRQRF